MQRGEYFNCLSHLFGLFLAIAGAVWLIDGTFTMGTRIPVTVGAIIFSMAAIFLYLCSSVYHASSGSMKRYWEKLDHCSIFALIAATVTPFLLESDMNLISWVTFLLIWLLALWGVTKELRSAQDAEPPLWLYLSLGWAGVFAVFQQWRHLSAMTLLLLLAGALAYTVGTYFYRNGARIPHAHGIWHLFVVAGTACHYFSIRAHLIGI